MLARSLRHFLAVLGCAYILILGTGTCTGRATAALANLKVHRTKLLEVQSRSKSASAVARDGDLSRDTRTRGVFDPPPPPPTQTPSLFGSDGSAAGNSGSVDARTTESLYGTLRTIAINQQGSNSLTDRYDTTLTRAQPNTPSGNSPLRDLLAISSGEEVNQRKYGNMPLPSPNSPQSTAAPYQKPSRPATFLDPYGRSWI